MARAASVGNRAPAHGGEASRGVLSSASDDGGGLTARCACSTQKRAASVGNRAPAHGGEASRGVLSSASDDGGGLTARCASSTQKKGDSGDMDNHTGVVVVGSINADLAAFGSPLPRPGETVIGTNFSLGLGGKGANQATAAVRAGAPTYLIGAVGDDFFGGLTRDALAEEGVDVTAVRIVDGLTGIAHIRVDAVSAQNDIMIIPNA